MDDLDRPDLENLRQRLRVLLAPVPAGVEVKSAFDPIEDTVFAATDHERAMVVGIDQNVQWSGVDLFVAEPHEFREQPVLNLTLAQTTEGHDALLKAVFYDWFSGEEPFDINRYKI